MKNIHILPTDKPSRLFKAGIEFIFDISEVKYTERYKELHNYINHTIYITSDEEIKEGNYVFNEASNEVYRITILNELVNYEKKIILTTDADLIKDGVQAIDDEFLEWFVKNPNCEWVDIETMMECEKCGKEHCDNLQCRGYKDIPYYKIIIPKEEPKQETLEEAAEKYVNKKGDISTTELEDAIFKQGFIDGANWQQEQMYSKEEVIQLLIKFNQEITEVEDVREWFEQFKKK